MRSSDNSFQILSTAATLSPLMTEHPYDSDGNGLDDSWAVDFSVNVATSSEFRLSAELVGSDGSSKILSHSFTATAGSVVTEALVIPLETLYSMQTGVNYSLVRPRLSESVQGQVVGQNLDYALSIPAIASFELPPSPIVSDILPNYGSYRGDYKVIVKGADFGTTSSVEVGGKVATFSVVANDTLSVTVPLRMVPVEATPLGGGGTGTPPLAPKAVSIKIVTAGGTITLPEAFTYVP